VAGVLAAGKPRATSGSQAIPRFLAFAGLARQVLLFDPGIGLGQPVVEGRGGLPAEHVQDHRIVAVAPGHAARGVELVLALQLHSGELLGQIDELVDRDQFARAQIDRRGNQPLAVGDHLDAAHAVVHIHEAARLRAVAPDFDRAGLLVLGLDHLAADGCGRLFASTVPGAERAIDIVESGDKRLQAALVPVFLAEHLRHQFLPAVAALGHGRIDVGLLQGTHVGVLLEPGVIDAGGGGEEISLGTGAIGGLDHVGVDEDAAQALHAEAFDKAHPSHVRGQVVHLGGAFAGTPAVLFNAQVQTQRLHARRALVPLAERLFVDRADARKTALVQIADQRAGDESAGAAHHDQGVLVGPVRRVFGHGVCLLGVELRTRGICAAGRAATGSCRGSAGSEPGPRRRLPDRITGFLPEIVLHGRAERSCISSHYRT